MMTRFGRRWLMMAGFWAAGVGAVCGAAEEEALSAEIDLPIRSAYVWRGQVLNDEAVFQPELALEKYGVGVGVWLNQNLTDATDRAGEWDEVDLTLYYTRDLGPINLTAGITEYLFPNQSKPLLVDPEAGLVSGGGALPSTREIFLALTPAESLEWGVQPTLTVNADLGEVEGGYAALALAHGRELGGVEVEGTASLGVADADYNAFYFGVDETAMNDLTVGLTVAQGLNAVWTLSGGVEYTVLCDGAIRDAADELYGHRDAWIFSGGLSGSF